MANPKRLKARLVGLEPFRVVSLDVENARGAYHRSSMQLSEKFPGSIDRLFNWIGELVEVEVLEGEIVLIRGPE